MYIHITKEVQLLHSENCKALWKETKEDLCEWKNIPCSWIRRLNIAEMAILP